MAASQLKSITQPSYHRTGSNLSGSDIPKARILKAGAAADEIALATAVTDTLLGVSTETMYDGKSQSYQVDGRVVIETGGAFSVGAELTTDSTGRAVGATQAAGASQKVIGRAVTASGGAAEFAEVELKQLGNTFSALLSTASRTTLAAIAASARFDGMLVMVLTDNSLWRFNSASTLTDDEAQELAVEPDAGTGCWIRVDKAFVMKIPISFANTDGEAIETIPEGFALRLTGHPYWEVTAEWTGGSSSAIGISTNVSGYETGGDILGGATGDVLATLVAGIAAGTQGGELVDEVAFHDLLLEEASEFQFDRITSAFTAGSGFVCIPVAVALAPATP
jgi:hypothetical protein